MSGLADDDDQSRGHPADMVATAERHGPDQQDTAERQNDDLENGEAANILERVESINKTRGAVAVTEEQHGAVAVTEEQRGADAVTEEQHGKTTDTNLGCRKNKNIQERGTTAASDKHSDADTAIDQHCSEKPAALRQEAAGSWKSGEAAKSLECGADAVTEEQHGKTTDLDGNKNWNNMECGATAASDLESNSAAWTDSEDEFDDDEFKMFVKRYHEMGAAEPTTPSTTATPGEADTATPGEADTATPGEADTATPGEADTATPGEEDDAPGEDNTATPIEASPAYVDNSVDDKGHHCSCDSGCVRLAAYVANGDDVQGHHCSCDVRCRLTEAPGEEDDAVRLEITATMQNLQALTHDPGEDKDATQELAPQCRGCGVYLASAWSVESTGK